MRTIVPGTFVCEHSVQSLHPHGEALGNGESYLLQLFLGWRETLRLHHLDDKGLRGCTQLADRLLMLSDDIVEL
jgi:hypothetical protein